MRRSVPRTPLERRLFSRVRETASHWAPAAAIVLSASGCVAKTHYDQVVADAASAKALAQAKQSEDGSRIQGLERQVAEDETRSQDLDAKLSDLTTADHNLQAKLDEATAINQQLRDELARLGKDVDKILADRGTLSKALDDAKGRLEELRKAQAAAQAHAELFRSLEQRFKPLEDAGQLRVETRRGQLVMNVAGDLLFDPGRSLLRAAGKGALMEIAHALATTPPGGHRFLVTANVDPPEAKEAKSHRAKSLWDLTAARSVAVVESLVSFGVPPGVLTAAAAASYDPIAANDTAEGKAMNRRVEIALLPLSGEALPVEPPK